MAPLDTRDLAHKLEQIEKRIGAYGYLLIASELGRPLPGLVPVLASAGIAEAEAGPLLKESLQRGGTQLLADLEDLERIARQAKDLEVFAVLNRIRQLGHFVSRYNAAALLQRLEPSAHVSPATASLHKEVEAFRHAAGRLAPGTHDVEEDFAEEDLPSGEPAADISLPVRGDAQEADAPPAHPPEDQAPRPTVVEFPPDDGGAVGWLRDRVEVFNDILRRWAFEESLDPETSPLVRRGQLSAEQCRALYAELLAEGAARLVPRCRELDVAGGEEGEQARALRGRIVDGADGAVPRLVGLLSAGVPVHTEIDGLAIEQTQVIADLNDYLRGAADLYDESSPLRARLLFLADEVSAALSSGA